MSHILTAKQIKAIYLLAEGKMTIEVGKAMKLRRETLSRWKRIPEFQLELERIMQEMCDDMKHRLTRLVSESISSVSRGLNGVYTDPKRLQTSFSVLKLLGIDRMLVADDIETTIKRDAMMVKRGHFAPKA